MELGIEGESWNEDNEIRKIQMEGKL